MTDSLYRRPYLDAPDGVQCVGEVLDAPWQEQPDAGPEHLEQRQGREEDGRRRAVSRQEQRHERGQQHHLPRHQVQGAVDAAPVAQGTQTAPLGAGIIGGGGALL